jgi:hypothetical protein
VPEQTGFFSVSDESEIKKHPSDDEKHHCPAVFYSLFDTAGGIKGPTVNPRSYFRPIPPNGTGPMFIHWSAPTIYLNGTLHTMDIQALPAGISFFVFETSAGKRVFKQYVK